MANQTDKSSATGLGLLAGTSDVVKNPNHYQIAPGIEAMDVIEGALEHLKDKLSPHEAHLLGTFLKYRLRLGDKDEVEQDLGKSNEYRRRLREHRAPQYTIKSDLLDSLRFNANPLFGNIGVLYPKS